MNMIKRIGITFGSYVEELSKTLENPKEVVGVSISEIDRNLAIAEQRLSKMHQEGCDLKSKLDSLTKESLEWETRAKRDAEQNRERALECLKRKNLCKEQVTFIAKLIKENQELETSLKDEITSVQNKRDELKSKLNFLSTKDASSKAVSSINNILNKQDNYLDEVLDSWELEINLRSDNKKFRSEQGIDSLKAEYERQEKKESLEKELENLIK